MSGDPPATKPMQAVISHLVPQATVQQVQPVSSVHCQRAYGVKISDGTSLVLVAPPPPMVKLLRSERASVVSEAAVLSWLASKTTAKPLLQERTPEPEDILDAGKIGTRGLRDLRSTANGAEDLHIFLPRLMAHTNAPSEEGREFNLLRPTMGVPIPELSPPLSSPERRSVDFQTGQFYRKLCRLVSPTGRFGPAFAVLPPATPIPPPDSAESIRRDLNARLMESRGVQSWSTAFHSMLEAVLRDGEDMQVMLGYGSIRQHFKQFQYTLESVKTPRLVAVDAGKDLNTLVMRRKCRKGPPSIASSHHLELRSESRVVDDSESETEDDDSSSELELGGDDRATPYHQSNIIMTGMKDWSNFVFGDPLFAVDFCHGPSSDFLSGFNDVSPDQVTTAMSAFSSDMIEDKATAHIRILLYECYHTITHIAREFFRPRRDSSGRELEARKKLNHILAQLDTLSDAGNQRGSRPSGESSPAKRSKSCEKR
ncbi:hypothetical protein GCG54_00004501 [Colletotrichum gloeosporioides]|uniref:Aminoglycoside phosphotransferase domain-containing protein n=1 Tax=Colletotrichum gloeosporioides TaxID=474922 RepID=A0A8H4FDG3_COLGL|nr:uncharacterized protein GCG54_00004501 [Colletotrichum gloeosporioides]KAF3797871.1 hypothetical protein GCG54_00004501 [Colletotrichum gloeosporioides]